jgi:hypothetical protein
VQAAPPVIIERPVLVEQLSSQPSALPVLDGGDVFAMPPAPPAEVHIHLHMPDQATPAQPMLVRRLTTATTTTTTTTKKPTTYHTSRLRTTTESDDALSQPIQALASGDLSQQQFCVDNPSHPLCAQSQQQLSAQSVLRPFGSGGLDGDPSAIPADVLRSLCSQNPEHPLCKQSPAVAPPSSGQQLIEARRGTSGLNTPISGLPADVSSMSRAIAFCTQNNQYAQTPMCQQAAAAMLVTGGGTQTTQAASTVQPPTQPPQPTDYQTGAPVTHTTQPTVAARRRAQVTSAAEDENLDSRAVTALSPRRQQLYCIEYATHFNHFCVAIDRQPIRVQQKLADYCDRYRRTCPQLGTDTASTTQGTTACTRDCTTCARQCICDNSLDAIRDECVRIVGFDTTTASCRQWMNECAQFYRDDGDNVSGGYAHTCVCRTRKFAENRRNARSIDRLPPIQHHTGHARSKLDSLYWQRFQLHLVE